MLQGLEIRPARPEDVGLLLSMVRELAEYEKLSHQVTAREEDLRKCLFAERPFAEALLAYWQGAPAAFALFFHTVSTFLGRPGVYLEDLYVKPALRGRGIGGELFRSVARLALQRGCGRLEWSVLDWNAPAIGFYTALGAEPLREWTMYRLSASDLERLAREA